MTLRDKINHIVYDYLNKQKFKNEIRAFVDLGIVMFSLVLLILLSYKLSISLNPKLLDNEIVKLSPCLKHKLILILMCFFYPMFDFIAVIKTCGICPLKTKMNKRARVIADVSSIIFRLISVYSLSFGLVHIKIKTLYIMLIMILIFISLFIVSFIDSDKPKFDIYKWLIKETKRLNK